MKKTKNQNQKRRKQPNVSAPWYASVLRLWKRSVLLTPKPKPKRKIAKAEAEPETKAKAYAKANTTANIHGIAFTLEKYIFHHKTLVAFKSKEIIRNW